MAQALVNPEMLSWARIRAQFSLDGLAQKMKLKQERLAAWESGELKPTFKQAQTFANKVHIPFGYLFLQKPPQEVLPLPDLRTIGSHDYRAEYSIDLLDTIRDVIMRQQWYKEYLQNQNSKPTQVFGRATLQDGVETIVNDIRVMLGVEKHPQRGSWEDYFRDLIKRIEGIGVLVMRNSMVGSNTHRSLSVDEFRGFALADEWAPVIFINTADYPGPRLFSLIHELAHIWIGRSGVSDAAPNNHREEEQLCNAVAAEFLAPAEEFMAMWQENADWKANIAVLKGHFHVSQWVIARRALDLGLIEFSAYQQFIRQCREAYKASERDGVPAYGTLQKGRVSPSFAAAVASEALSGRMLLRDAAQLIGIKPHRIAEFSRKELGF